MSIFEKSKKVLKKTLGDESSNENALNFKKGVKNVLR